MRHKFIALLAVLLLLGGCHRAAVPAPSPSEMVTPTPTSTPTPEPTKEVKELWGFPIDDAHDAFEVDTKGKLGTVLVTVERGEEAAEELLNGYHYTLSVWDESDLTTPIQTFEETSFALNDTCGYWSELEDANFDGYTDFFYVWNRYASNLDFCLYVWDEPQEKFAFVTSFVGRDVGIDKETQTIFNSTYYLGGHVDESYHWEDGELVCFRKEEYEALNDELQRVEHVIYELVDGEMVETLRETYAMQGL